MGWWNIPCWPNETKSSCDRLGMGWHCDFTVWYYSLFWLQYFNGLVQERRNSIANAIELHLYCTNPSIFPQNSYKKIQKLTFDVWKLICVLFSSLQCYMQHHGIFYRYHFVNAPSRIETALHCYIISHWLGVYTKRSLYFTMSSLDQAGTPCRMSLYKCVGTILS